MNFREYLDKHGITYREFAEKLGIHPQSLKNIACGMRRPGLRLSLKIEELTNGEVTPRELVENFEITLKNKENCKSKDKSKDQ